MALTNALLKSMGIEGDQRDQIMAEHQATLSEIKAERDGLRDTAAKVPELEKKAEEAEGLEKKVAELQEELGKAEELKKEVASKQEELDALKAQVQADKEEAEKAALYRAALKEAGVGERFLDDIMNVVDLSNVEVENGALKDPEAVKSTVDEKFSSFVSQTRQVGASVPPSNDAGAGVPGSNREVVDMLKERHARLYGTAKDKE